MHTCCACITKHPVDAVSISVKVLHHSHCGEEIRETQMHSTVNSLFVNCLQRSKQWKEECRKRKSGWEKKVQTIVRNGLEFFWLIWGLFISVQCWTSINISAPSWSWTPSRRCRKVSSGILFWQPGSFSQSNQAGSLFQLTAIEEDGSEKGLLVLQLDLLVRLMVLLCQILF